MSISSRKQKLRSEIRNSFSCCNAGELLQYSKKLTSRLTAEIAKRSPRRVFLYLEMEKEVKVSPMIPWLFSKGILVFVPFKQKNEWHVAQINRETEINFGDVNVSHQMPQPGSQLVPQPVSQPVMPVTVRKSISDFGFINSDIAIVPGLAFSKSGERLGRGGGVYDSYLSGGEVFKIGVCFGFQLREDIPHDAMDVQMDLVISG